jgi:hypothetical protein
MNSERSFEILQLKPHASAEEIRQAFLDLVQVWHPDRFAGNSRLQEIAENRLREINEAYRILQTATPIGEPRPEAQEATETLRGSHFMHPPEASTTNRGLIEPEAMPAAPQSAISTGDAVRRKLAVRTIAVALLVLAVGIGTDRLYDALRTPVGSLDRMLADIRRVDAEIGPALAGAGYGWRFDMPQGLAPMFDSRRSAPGAGGRSISVSRGTSRVDANPEIPPGAPIPQSFVRGGEGEIELRNETEADATLVLMTTRAPGRVLKSSSLPSGGGAIIRGLSPEIYSLDVTFADYPRSPVHLGPFVIVQTVTAQGIVADRYEIRLRPRESR